MNRTKIVPKFFGNKNKGDNTNNTNNKKHLKAPDITQDNFLLSSGNRNRDPAGHGIKGLAGFVFIGVTERVRPSS
jgi:hypothetical protein